MCGVRGVGRLRGAQSQTALGLFVRQLACSSAASAYAISKAVISLHVLHTSCVDAHQKRLNETGQKPHLCDGSCSFLRATPKKRQRPGRAEATAPASPRARHYPRHAPPRHGRAGGSWLPQPHVGVLILAQVAAQLRNRARTTIGKRAVKPRRGAGPVVDVVCRSHRTEARGTSITDTFDNRDGSGEAFFVALL